MPVTQGRAFVVFAYLAGTDLLGSQHEPAGLGFTGSRPAQVKAPEPLTTQATATKDIDVAVEVMARPEHCQSGFGQQIKGGKGVGQSGPFPSRRTSRIQTRRVARSKRQAR